MRELKIVKMKCPEIVAGVKLRCDTSPLKKSVYVFAGESLYRDGELYGNITHHDRESKTISFTIISDNKFMHGVKSSLNYK